MELLFILTLIIMAILILLIGTHLQIVQATLISTLILKIHLAPINGKKMYL